MDSKTILKQAVEQSFNGQKFKQFIADFLNDYSPAQASLISLYSNFSGYITEFNLIGEYQDPQGKKLNILEVELKNAHKLEHARATQRNLIAKYLEDNWLDGALVAFHTPGYPCWRFSFVKLAWEFDKENKKTKKILSPAKRYSFLIGQSEPSHTAQVQLLPILEQEKAPTLEQIEETFSVERVTREFYQEYKKLFDKLCEELDKNRVFQGIKETKRIDTANFAKKLLGQVVFLYFIQKKGWLGVPGDKKWGEGDRSFLRHLLEEARGKNENFFNDYLEELFYNTLNNSRNNQVDRDYSKYFGCKIPFLNGGLFEPMKGYQWDKTFLLLDDDLFSNSKETGILDIFDRYNFTVKEDEPLEKEVAVDPEMLGKVFENLLEEILRKSKGIYYTPREIVHYMCQESLINYLTTEHSNLSEENVRTYIKYGEALSLSKDLSELKKVWKGESFTPGQWKELDELLENIKVVDPACGSGAFLVGMLQEVVRLRLFLQLTLDSELFSKSSKNSIREKSEYQLKKETIQNCIYGVDIDPGAVEIAKLRLWLSLVVDYELEDIEPLPNLDYKIMQGNSLLEELVLGDVSVKLFEPGSISDQRENMKNLFDKEVQTDLFGASDKQRKTIEKLIKLHKEYFEASDLEKKKSIKAEIDKIEQDLIEQSVKEEVKKLENEIKNLGNYIIPGVGLTKKDADKREKALSNQAQIMGILNEVKESGVRPFFLWRLHFADVFEKKGGFDIVIANPPYVRISGIEKQEDRTIRNQYKTVFGHYDIYIPFMEKGIYLLNQKGILTYITSNKYLTKRYANKLRPFLLEETELIALIDTSQAKTFDSASVYPVITILSKNKTGKKTKIVIVDDKVFQLFFQSGIKGEEYFIDQRDFKNNKNNIFDIFINPRGRKLCNKIEADTKLLGSYSRTLTGTPAINKFYEWNKLLFPEAKVPNKKSLKFINVSNIKPYHIGWGKEIRAVGNRIARPYLLFDERLIGRNKWSVFEKRKIVIKGNAKKLTAAYDDIGYANLSLYAVIFSKDHSNRNKTFYHLALINSKLLNYWYCKKFASSNLAGNYISFNGIYLEQLPIKDASSIKQEPFIDLVDKILVITKSNDYLKNEAKQKKVKEYECQIDKMVYKLYGLEPEEIKIVEGFNKN